MEGTTPLRKQHAHTLNILNFLVIEHFHEKQIIITLKYQTSNQLSSIY